MISSLLAAYGALLSTVLAFISIGNFRRSRSYLEILVDRSYGPSNPDSDVLDESVEFKISNRSTNKTEIQNLMIGICEFSPEGYVRSYLAWGFDAFKSSRLWDRGDEPLSLPLSLHPGESVYIEFEAKDARRFIEEATRDAEADVRIANVFELEIEHSQGDPRRLFFSMERRRLVSDKQLPDVDKFSLWRSRIWRFYRSPF